MHGPLQGAWLSQYVTDWAGPRGRMLTLTWQNRRSALPEHDYMFRGVVRAVDGDVVELEVWGAGRRRRADARHGDGPPARRPDPTRSSGIDPLEASGSTFR